MKKMVIILLCVVCVLPFLSCRKDTEEAAASEGPVVVRFWHMDDSGPRKEAMEEIIANFNALHEGSIRVEATGINFWDYWDKISVSMAAKEEPDVFLHDLGNVGMRAETGVLQNLSELYAGVEENPEDTFFAAPLEMCLYDGKYYALPFEMDVRLLFYNKDMFAEVGLDPERPPQTWEELWEMAARLVVKFEDGSYDRMGFNLLLPQSYFLTYVWGCGASYLNDEGKIQVNSDEIVNALEEWKAIVDRFGHDRLTHFSSEFGGGAADPFIVEKLGMTVGVPDFYSQIRQYNPDMNFGYAQVPYPAGPVSWSNGFSLEMSSRSDHPDEAFTFIRYLMGRDAQFIKAGKSSALVTNKEAATDPGLMADPFWQMTVDTMKVTHFRPFVIESPTWYDLMNKEVDEVVYGRKAPREALDQAQALIDNDIKKYHMRKQ